MFTALLVIAILVLLIVVHEFGHFIVAKLSGVRVEEFGIGYPPRAFSLGRWGDTLYTLNWIPFGGFVRLFGDDDDGVRGKGSYVDAPRYKQALILVAGVGGNIIAGWFLFAAAYHTGILHTVDSPGAGTRLLVTDVLTGSPADAAGIHEGDYVTDIEDAQGAHATMTPAGAAAFFSSRGGQNISFFYLRGAQKMAARVRPAQAVVPDAAERAAIGVGLGLVTSSPVAWPSAFSEAGVSTYNTLTIVVSGVGTLLRQTVHGELNLEEVTGPVGLLGAVSDATRSGWGYVLSLAAFISVNLAVINLIPIPALDGGRLVVVFLEALMRRRAPRLAIQLLNTVGLAMIILLMVAVTYHDVVRLLV